jgi:DNA-binding PadR family transcriptional regulator
MNHDSRISPKANFFESSLSESSLAQNKAKEASMLYTITPEGKIKLHRDLSKWRKPVGKNEYYETAQSPHEKAQEKEWAALITRSTKELSLDQESAVAIKAMRKQEYLDHLAN